MYDARCSNLTNLCIVGGCGENGVMESSNYDQIVKGM